MYVGLVFKTLTLSGCSPLLLINQKFSITAGKAQTCHSHTESRISSKDFGHVWVEVKERSHLSSGSWTQGGDFVCLQSVRISPGSDEFIKVRPVPH